MTGSAARRFDRAYKLAALARMAAGENVSALGRELGVRRKLLYQWRDTVRRGGVEALELDFFGQALQLMEQAGRRPSRPQGSQAAGRAGLHGLIRALRGPRPRPLQGSDDPAAAGSWTRRQGGLSVERMCGLLEVSRAGYHRHWRASAPGEEETALRDRL